MFGPAYQGVSVTIEGITRVSATFIETNGLHVIWVPIVPVLLSGIALMAVRRTGPGPTGRRLLLWTISVVFLGFCALGLFSFGFLYLPVALALIIVAVTDLGRIARGSGRRSSGLKRMMSRWRRGRRKSSVG